MSINSITTSLSPIHPLKGEFDVEKAEASSSTAIDTENVLVKGKLMEEFLSAVSSVAIHASNRLGIIEKLKENPTSIEMLSSELNLSAKHLSRTLAVLGKLKLVEVKGEQYELTELGSRLDFYSKGEREAIYHGALWIELCTASDVLTGEHPLIEKVAALLHDGRIGHEEKQLYDLATNYLWSRIIYFAVELNLADRIASGTRSTDSLANSLHLDEGALRILLELLQEKGIIYEEGSMWNLTERGQELRISKPGSLAHHIIFDDTKRWECLGLIDESIRCGAIPFEEKYGELFEYLKENPSESKKFDLAMDTITTLESAELLKSGVFDGASEIVEIGGGRGLFLSSIMEKYPDMKGVLFDLPSVANHENVLLELSEENFRDRVSIVGGSFFEFVPKSCGMYCMKRVLHDWDDDHVVSIFKQIEKNMLPGAKIAIIEPLLSEGDERITPELIDFYMMPLLEGRERSMSEMERLLNAAGFELTGKQIVGSFLSILVAEKK